MATATEPAASERHDVAGVVIDGATWADYEAMLGIIGERRIFVNYDHGVMEVMVPSHLHETIGDFLGLMVDILSEELEVPCEAGGSTTHRREDLEKGVEPDRCFWLHAKAIPMLGRRDLDLAIDPAPSLVIEVNYTSSSVDRMAIFAALGVDEVWRFHRGLEFLFLEGGGYRQTDRSLNFPMLTLAEANRLLEKTQTTGRVPWMKAFRQHVRENLVPRPRKPHDGADQP
ncbi:MAG: Uma2 family endonuclease [Isosphaerales bacterium]